MKNLITILALGLLLTSCTKESLIEPIEEPKTDCTCVQEHYIYYFNPDNSILFVSEEENCVNAQVVWEYIGSAPADYLTCADDGLILQCTAMSNDHAEKVIVNCN